MQKNINNRHDPMKKNRLLENITFFLFAALTLLVCRSKSAVDIVFGILILISVYYLIRHADREYLKQNRHIIVLLLPLAVGFCLSLFSLAGPVKGAVVFLERYRFFLMVIPFTLFVRSEKKINTLFILLNVTAFVAVVYGFTQLHMPKIWGKSVGFHTIGRNSDLLMSIGLINLVGPLSYRVENRAWNIASKVLIGTNTALILTAVFLMLRRGSYLGLVVGIFVFLIATRKKKILALVIIALCSALFFTNSVVVQRVKSIVDFKDDNSNRERIQLFRTGTAYLIDERLFFHGTGGKNSVEPFTEYFYSHSAEYQKKNVDIVRKQYFGNFHNSFLQMAVEYGLFFLLCYLASIFYILVRLFKSLRYLTGNHKVYPMAAIVITFGFFVSQFFHSDLYSYGGIPFLLTSAAGCHVFNQQQIQAKKTDTGGIPHATTDYDGR
jgi:O-antigen ligase